MIILSDGTFSIAPKLWTQVFIISVQVSDGVFIPVCFALLPDKKHSTYDAMFEMLLEAQELSAEYFMNDFETAMSLISVESSQRLHFPLLESHHLQGPAEWLQV